MHARFRCGTQSLRSLLGKSKLTNHGIWDGFYLWPLHNTIGTY
jgi:hypothetical protein